MENKKDLLEIWKYVARIKDNHNSNVQRLNAINMLMVDNNNSRVKDTEIAQEIGTLESKLKEVSSVIDKVEKLLMQKQES